MPSIRKEDTIDSKTFCIDKRLLVGIVADGRRSRTDIVHVISYLAQFPDSLVIRSIADVGEPDLKILSVETARACLIGELMPVRADQIRMFQGRADIPVVHFSPLRLIPGIA